MSHLNLLQRRAFEPKPVTSGDLERRPPPVALVMHFSRYWSGIHNLLQQNRPLRPQVCKRPSTTRQVPLAGGPTSTGCHPRRGGPSPKLYPPTEIFHWSSANVLTIGPGREDTVLLHKTTCMRRIEAPPVARR